MWNWEMTNASEEVGVDECARGVLLGRVYAGACVWDCNDLQHLPFALKSMDSKKISPRRRLILNDFIKEHAKAFGVGFMSEEDVDTFGIKHSVCAAMHKALRMTEERAAFTHILVDGIEFPVAYYSNEDYPVNYTLIPKGDSKYFSIGAASILAKVAHDKYINNLCQELPDLHEKYGLANNMGYGTRKHLEGIANFGPCNLHRKSFKPISLI